ncbi:tyrosine-type recombinase/integrase [Agromyces seonyuensis]|uniref:Tyrosine-type recombinase/integrase n=1 Tax=Agromyces seonyuensis TaxID=2662446 RepID=A0A6I4P2P5_9MICO|nr:tyrosine-type recombinase/integrase [Agromyces seonyuensis]MWB99025.1 tyrosine-type recombinase/integrase [Agromyces seonyuensis]
MAGRPRQPVGTFGSITTTEVERGKFRATTRFRDWDGQSRKVSATGKSRRAAESALKVELQNRMHVGGGQDEVLADSPFAELAAAWVEDLRLDVDRAASTKAQYERALRLWVMPAFENFTVREMTVARLDRFLKVQRTTSYSRAKQSKTILSMILGFAVRHGVLASNPIKEVAQMKRPKRVPKALTLEQIAAIRLAAYEHGIGRPGMKPSGLVRDVIEVMLGTATRIGEALAIRKCDVDMTIDPPTVRIAGTIVWHKGAGVSRQSHPKTHESNRVVAVPSFAAEVMRRRLAMIPDAERQDPEHLLFFTRNGTPVAPYNVRRTFREILEEAGLSGLQISPHAFRRTGATLIAHELGLQAAADQLGHTSTTTTKEHYAERDTRVNPLPAKVLQQLAPKGPSGADGSEWEEPE